MFPGRSCFWVGGSRNDNPSYDLLGLYQKESHYLVQGLSASLANRSGNRFQVRIVLIYHVVPETLKLPHKLGAVHVQYVLA